MNKRLGVLAIFALAGAFALAWGLSMAHSARGVILDYRVMDLGARCLLQHRDLYSEAEMLQLLESEMDHQPPLAPSQSRYLATLQVYPPSAELAFAPFALFLWPITYRIWTALTYALLVIATFLMWDVARTYAADPPFLLACIVLTNSGILFSGGNPAGIAVSLCVISFWFFYQNRLRLLGVLCLAFSLAIKPHDAGFIWLYLLLLGAEYRRQAVRVLAVTVVLSVAALAWISEVSPNWFREIQANMATISSAGFYNDPATSNAALILNLQTVLAAFRNKPEFYNIATFLICLPFLVLWAYLTVRFRHSSKSVWLGVAAIAPLSLLPVYHRPYDAKILLLCLPACSALWAERGRVAWAAILATGAGVVITSDMPVAILSMVSPSTQIKSGVVEVLANILTTRPAPIVLLSMSSFYLWAYFKLYKSESTGSSPGRRSLDRHRSAQLETLS